MNIKYSKEISELVKNSVISEEVASNIESYYKSKQPNATNSLFVIFGILGAALVGLGFILILAHNWDSFPKTLKTFFAFFPLVMGQLLVGYSIFKKKSTTWREASGTFLFFSVGACIALVSQIYNIPGDLSSYLLTWIFLCVPLIYLLKSKAVAFLHIVFATYYACEYGYSFFSTSHAPWYFLLMLALLIPYYLTLLKKQPTANVTSIFNWLIPLSLIITLGAFIDKMDSLGFLMYVILFGLFYNIGKIPFFDSQKLRRNGYLVFGSFGTIVLLMILSFRIVWEDIKIEYIFSQELLISIILFAAALGLVFYAHSKKQVKQLNLFRYVFVIISVLFFIQFGKTVIPTVLINLIILSLGLIAIKIGSERVHFGILNYGLLIITALIICRFFDTDMSFVLRGILFVGVGVGFFFTNYLMLKKQKKSHNNIDI